MEGFMAGAVLGATVFFFQNWDVIAYNIIDYAGTAASQYVINQATKFGSSTADTVLSSAKTLHTKLYSLKDFMNMKKK